jgi:hypothetical protein
MSITLLAGCLAADFASGLAHWAPDTWGSDDLLVVGPRLLRPFSLHHANPDDFLRRSFIDTNGDVAPVAAAGLAGLLVVPRETPWCAAAAVAGVGFCGLGMTTTRFISGRTCRRRRRRSAFFSVWS